MVSVKLAVSVVAALSALALGLSRLDQPPGFWGDRVWLIVALLVVVFLWSAFDAIDRAISASRAKRAAKLDSIRAAGETVLKAALVRTVQDSEVPWTEVGLHLFLVARKWQRKWPFRVAYLWHARRVKMSEFPPPTGIVWTKGKGVVGRCWATGGFVSCDVRNAYAPYLSSTESEWNQLDSDKRFGLTFAEFSLTKDHAGTILAAPILTAAGNGGHQFAGCVSLDAPGDCYAQLATVEIKQTLQFAAATIGELLKAANR